MAEFFRNFIDGGEGVFSYVTLGKYLWFFIVSWFSF